MYITPELWIDSIFVSKFAFKGTLSHHQMNSAVYAATCIVATLSWEIFECLSIPLSSLVMRKSVSHTVERSLALQYNLQGIVLTWSTGRTMRRRQQMWSNEANTKRYRAEPFIDWDCIWNAVATASRTSNEHSKWTQCAGLNLIITNVLHRLAQNWTIHQKTGLPRYSVMWLSPSARVFSVRATKIFSGTP